MTVLRGDPVARFWSKVDKSGECWLWTAGLDEDGYGQFWSPEQRTVKAYAHAYRMEVGEVPAGMELDHLCRVRRCVRPSHLEPVTGQVNKLRGTGFAATNASKVECKRGHPLEGDNLMSFPEGRRCRTCRRASWVRYQRVARGRDVLPV